MAALRPCRHVIRDSVFKPVQSLKIVTSLGSQFRRSYAQYTPKVKERHSSKKLARPKLSHQREMEALYRDALDNLVKKIPEIARLYCSAHDIDHGREELAEFFSEFHTFIANNGRATSKNVDLSAFRAFTRMHPVYNSHPVAVAQIANTMLYTQSGYLHRLGHNLLRYMSYDGLHQVLIWHLSQMLIDAQTTNTELYDHPDLKPLRQRLQQYISTSDNVDFRALVFEGKVLEIQGHHDQAIDYFTRAMPMAQLASKRRRETNLLQKVGKVTRAVRGSTEDLDELIGVPELMTPWVDAMRVYEVTLNQPEMTRAQHQKLVADFHKVIDVALEEDEALGNYYAAVLIQQQYVIDEQVESWNKETGKLIRPRRPRSQIGKCSQWLYHHTKAAVSGLPESAVELGDFYWQTEWPYLDDEPPPRVKPTPLDRYPASHTWNDSKKRLLRAVGLSASQPTPEDMFQTIAVANTVTQRLQLAIDWYSAAAKIYYPLALRGLAEIYSTSKISSNIAAPSDALLLGPSRYLCESEAEWHLALSNGIYPMRQRESSELIDNPFFNEDKAKSCIRELLFALQARETYTAAKAQSDPTDIDAARKLFHKRVNVMDNMADVRKWLRLPEIFNLWVAEDRDCDEWKNFIHTVCKNNSWKIYDEQQALLYAP